MGTLVMSFLGNWALGKVQSFGSKLLALPGQLLRGLLGMVGSIAKGVLGIAAGTILGFTTLLKSSMEALRNFASAVEGLANQSGASHGQALNLINGFRALGIAPEETASIFGSTSMHPELFNARSGALRAPDVNDKSFVLKLQTWFQGMLKGGGLGNFLNARSRLDSLFGGNVSAGLLDLVNTDPSKTRREMDWHNSLQSRLGVTPDTLGRVAEDLDFLINRVSVFADTVKMKFAAELLPTMEAVFGGVSELLLRNSDSIAGGLKNFGHWMFVEMPDLAIDGLKTLVKWTEAFGSAVFNTADAALNLVRLMHGKQGILYSLLGGIAKYFDFIVNSTIVFGTGLKMAMQLFENIILLNPVLGPAAKLAGLNFQYKSPIEAGREYFDSFKPSRLFESFDRSVTDPEFGKRIEKAQASINNGRKDFSRGARIANNFTKDMEKSLGTSNDRERIWQEKLLKAVEEGNEEVVAALNDVPDAMRGAIGHVGASYAMRSVRLRRA